MAASAGGLKALGKVLGELPAGFPVSIVVVQHLDPRYPSHMAELLGRKTKLSVRQAEDGGRLEPSTVFVAPPDRHLLVNADDTLSLTRTELVHFVRPSADLLFESVAASHANRAIAAVLTGTGVDGAMGVQAIKENRGIVIAQDERTSEFSAMPAAAIRTGAVDFVLPLGEIAPTLVRLVREGAEES